MRKISLRARLILSFLLIAILVVSTLLSLYYTTYRQSVENSAISSTMRQLDAVQGNVDYFLREGKNDLTELATDTATISIINTYNQTDSIERYLAISELHEVIRNTMRNSRIITSIEVSTLNQSLAASPYKIFHQDINSSELFNSFISNPERVIWEGTRDIEYQDFVGYQFVLDSHKAITVSVKIRSHIDGRFIGLATALVREKNIFSLMDNTNTTHQGELFIIDKQGNIVSHSNKALLNSIVSQDIFSQVDTGKDYSGSQPDWNLLERDNSTYLLSYSRLNEADWYIISLIDYQMLMQPFYRMLRLVGVIAIFLLFAILFLSIVVTTSISRPVNHVISAMKTIDFNVFQKISSPAANDEIAELASQYNKMVAKLDYMFTEVENAHTKQRDAEIKALQMQINPHFLYNTLDSINWMAYISGQGDISDMVLSLSNFFRLSLNKGSEVYTIADELKHVKSYAHIQKFRYRNKLNIHYDIDQTALSCKTIKILLQPLVENSIVHGFEEQNGYGNIFISIKKSEDSIFLEVADDGAGFPHDIEGPDFMLPESQGYGLKNIDERIKLFFGSQYGISIRRRQPKGTTVLLHIKALA